MTLEYGGEGDYVDEKSERERETKKEKHPAHVRCGRTCPSILAVSLPPIAVPSPTQLTLWIFGSPICVRLVVSFIRYLVVS
jgi:hypothetical protein